MGQNEPPRPERGRQEHDLEDDDGWLSTILFRPELRYEHAYQLPACDNGANKSQLMFAST